MAACSSTNITFRSNPTKAAITVKPLGGGAFKQIGETPMTVSASQLDKDFAGSGPLMVEFNKEGYKAQKMVVTELSAIDLTLDVELQPANGLEDPTTMNAQIDKLFECQRLVRVQRYPEALKMIEEIRKVTPQLSALYELEGGIYYLEGKKSEALDSYRAAARLNPKSVEAVRMRDLIENSISGGRLPASAPGKGN